MESTQKLQQHLKACIEAIRIYREADMKRDQSSILTTEESEKVAKAVNEAKKVIDGASKT